MLQKPVGSEASCVICCSPLRAEIERKDSSGKADQAIKWARENGVRINRISLARHRINHLRNGIEAVVVPPEDISSPAKKEPTVVAVIGQVSDLEFLDAVKDRVYRKLIAEEVDLKLESAFKAIELKHKISEESQNEKLLLEILSEIRSDELRRAAPHSSDHY